MINGVFTTQELLLLGFFAAYLAWLGIAAFVVVTRTIRDAHDEVVRRVDAVLRPHRFADTPPPDAEAIVDRLIRQLSRRSISRIAADAATPLWVARPLARRALAARRERLLARAATHTSERTRWRRIAALRILARADAPESVELLRHAVRDADEEVAGAAVRMLGEVERPEAADALVHALRIGAHAPGRIASQLDTFPLEVPETIRTLLEDSDPTVRFWGATLVVRYADLPEIRRKLATLGGDADANVRAAAVETLGRLGGDEALRTALGLLADDAPFVRAHAARALGQLGEPQSLRLLATLLEDGDWWVRSAAKEALVAFGADAVRHVLVYLDHTDRFARQGAVEVIQNTGALDELLADAARETEPGAKTALLRKVVAAGGFRFAAAARERVGPAVADVDRVLSLVVQESDAA